MIQYQYEQSDMVTWIKNLGDLLHTEVKDNCLTLPGHVGEGFFYSGNLGNGMSFMYVNALFHQDFLLHRSASEESGLVLYFTELQIAGYYKAASGSQEVIDRHKERKNVYLNSTRYPLEVHLTNKSRLRMVGIKFSEKLVRKFIKSNNLVYFKDFTQHSLKNTSDDYLTPQVQKLLQEVYDANVQNPLGRLVLFNRILLLVEKFLHLFFIRELPSDKQYLPSEEEKENLEKIEEFLRSIPDDFPSIQKLARMAMMSSTKLKTRFKEVYGMKLYEYYNHNRLAKARQWIENGEASVQDVAYRVGFTNSSNFSKAFKKEFGVLPSQLKA
jgi:AraC-like DNA-binding protein